MITKKFTLRYTYTLLGMTTSYRQRKVVFAEKPEGCFSGSELWVSERSMYEGLYVLQVVDYKWHGTPEAVAWTLC